MLGPMATRRDEQVAVPHGGVEHVSVRTDAPEGAEPRGVFVLAHGAGAPMDSGFLEAIAPRIADVAGLVVVRFNYAFTELARRSGKRRPPERRIALEAVHGPILRHVAEAHGGLPLYAGGKSLGGRVSSLMAAESHGAMEPVRGLIFLGYPLHPPGKPDRLRTEHFPQLRGPLLFLQGDRDALCDLALLEDAWPALAGAEPTLHVVEGADHGFEVLRRSGRTLDDVHAELAGAISGWCDLRGDEGAGPG